MENILEIGKDHDRVYLDKMYSEDYYCEDFYSEDYYGGEES